MNVYDFWSSRHGVVGFIITDLSSEDFTKVIHSFQSENYEEDGDTDEAFEKMKQFIEQKGINAQLYRVKDTVYWWVTN